MLKSVSEGFFVCYNLLWMCRRVQLTSCISLFPTSFRTSMDSTSRQPSRDCSASSCWRVCFRTPSFHPTPKVSWCTSTTYVRFNQSLLRIRPIYSWAWRRHKDFAYTLYRGTWKCDVIPQARSRWSHASFIGLNCILWERPPCKFLPFPLKGIRGITSGKLFEIADARRRVLALLDTKATH